MDGGTGTGKVVKRTNLLKYTRDRRLWRYMIDYALKKHIEVETSCAIGQNRP